MLDSLPVEPGAFYIFDRGYFDARRLYRLTRTGAYFVIRARANLQFRRVSSVALSNDTSIRADQIIRLCGQDTKHYYPKTLRRVCIFDSEQKRAFVFLSNNFELSAFQIAELYRNRWHIELFFKWIKQNLKIKKFFGHSINAVKTQVWISVATYVLIAIVKKRLALTQPLSEILHVLSVAPFEKMPIFQAFHRPPAPQINEPSSNQLKLF